MPRGRTDTSDDDNESTATPSHHQSQQQQQQPAAHEPQPPQEQQEVPRTGGQPPPAPPPQQQNPVAAPAMPPPQSPQRQPRTSPTRPHLPSAGAGGGAAASGGAGPSYGASPWPRPPAMFPLGRGRQLVSHPIALSLPATPTASPPAQRPMPLYPLLTRPPAPPQYGDAGAAHDDDGDEPATLVPQRVRRVAIPSGHAPPPPPPPIHMRLQEGPWRAFAGPRLVARPLRPSHPRAEAAAPYDMPPGDPLQPFPLPPQLHVRHHPYAPQPLSPLVAPPPRGPIVPAAYHRGISPRQRSGGHPYAAVAPPPPWMDPRAGGQRPPPYGLGRLHPAFAPLPQPMQLPMPYPGPHRSQLPPHLMHGRPRAAAASFEDAREAAAAAAAAATAVGPPPPHLAGEQSGESPSGLAGGGDGEGSTASPPSLSLNPDVDPQRIEVTVAIRIGRAAAAAAAAVGAAAGTAAGGSGRDGAGGGRAEEGAEAQSGYVRGPVCGIFDVPRYLAGRDCIYHNSRWMSRSNFERVGGSKMAKWYRSIRVLPDLEPLGEWLERHGMDVTKGPTRRTSKRAADSGDELLRAAAAAAAAALSPHGAAAATAALGPRGSPDADDAALAAAGYDALGRPVRSPMRHDSGAAAGVGGVGDISSVPAKRLLATSPLHTATAVRPPLPLQSSLPQQSPPARPGEAAGVYAIPVRQPGSGSTAAAAAAGLQEQQYQPPRLHHQHQRHREQQLQPSQQPQPQPQQQPAQQEAMQAGDAEPEEDVATLRWLLRQTGRAARQQQQQQQQQQQAASPTAQLPMHWAAVPQSPPGGSELLRPARRQRVASAHGRNDVDAGEHGDAGSGSDNDTDPQQGQGLQPLPPPPHRQRPTAGAAATATAAGSSAPRQRQRTAEILRPEEPPTISRPGTLSRSAHTSPTQQRKEKDDPGAAVAIAAAERASLYTSQPQTLGSRLPVSDVPYYRTGHRVATIAAPPPSGQQGASGSGAGPTPAAAMGPTLIAMQPTRAMRQRHAGDPEQRSLPLERRTVRQPPQNQNQQQQPQQPPQPQLRYLRLPMQRDGQTVWVQEAWGRGENMDEQELEQPGDIEGEQEPRAHFRHAEALRGLRREPSPLLPQQQQQQQQQQQSLQHDIDSQQRSDLEVHAIRHRAMRRRRQQGRGPEDEADDEEDWERTS
nr:RlsC [Volvox powersii]